MFFARDMLQERSAGFDAKLQAKDSLMNSGLVCALLLTMVISALQADSPTPEPTTILSMYYTVSLNVSYGGLHCHFWAPAPHIYFHPPPFPTDEPLLFYECNGNLGAMPGLHPASGNEHGATLARPYSTS